jgi:hypothetical protein
MLPHLLHNHIPHNRTHQRSPFLRLAEHLFPPIFPAWAAGRHAPNYLGGLRCECAEEVICKRGVWGQGEGEEVFGERVHEYAEVRYLIAYLDVAEGVFWFGDGGLDGGCGIAYDQFRLRRGDDVTRERIGVGEPWVLFFLLRDGLLLGRSDGLHNIFDGSIGRRGSHFAHWRHTRRAFGLARRRRRRGHKEIIPLHPFKSIGILSRHNRPERLIIIHKPSRQFRPRRRRTLIVVAVRYQFRCCGHYA